MGARVRALRSYRLAVGGAVDAAGAQQVEAACRVQAAAALPAVAQAAVIVLHQRLARPQHASFSEHAHCLAYWRHTHTHTARSEVTVCQAAGSICYFVMFFFYQHYLRHVTLNIHHGSIKWLNKLPKLTDEKPLKTCFSLVIKCIQV